jgi:hypothetical protein
MLAEKSLNSGMRFLRKAALLGGPILSRGALCSEKQDPPMTLGNMRPMVLVAMLAQRAVGKA